MGRIRAPGWVFAVIMALLLLSAWNTGANLLYIVFGGVLSFILLSFLLAWWDLRQVTLSRTAPSAVHRGQSFLIETRVENAKVAVPAISLRVEAASLLNQSLGYFLKVPPRRAALLNVPFTFPERGAYPLPPFDLATSFPFGIYERRRRFSDNQEVVVYPRVRPLRSSAVEQMSGARLTARSASSDGDEFFGLREYIAGDDVRHIVWRVSARMGKWMVRELAIDNARHVIFALDTQWRPHISDFTDHFEAMVELTASLAVTLLYRQYTVGLLTPEGGVEGAEGTAQERRLLDFLARIQLAETDGGKFAQRIRNHESPEVKIVPLSPDPVVWGATSEAGGGRVLDPREVIYA